MNIEYNLVLIKGKDKTDEISSCNLENEKYYVRFKDNNEIKKYNLDDIMWLNNPVQLDISKTVIPNDICLSEISKILSFKEYKKIFLNTGKVALYNENNFIKEGKYLSNDKSTDTFEYLKELSNCDSILNGDVETYLFRQYNKINRVNPRSILSLYLNPRSLKRLDLTEITQPIFPFGFNLSQKEATQKALEEKFSVIEGPPGTGKTQTILNIIANAVLNGKTVAVVSNNNAAASNIKEKLDKYGLSFITANLGNKNNISTFLEEQTGLYPNMEEWNMSSDEDNDMKIKLISLGKRLEESLEGKNISANKKREENDYLTEKAHFDNYYNEKYKEVITHNSKHNFDSDNLMNMIVEYKNIIEQSKKFTFIYKLKWLIRYGIFNFKFYNNSHDSIVALFEQKYYEQKIKEIELDRLKSYPKNKDIDFNSNMCEYTDVSMKIFKSYLSNRYNKVKRTIFSKKDLINYTESFVKEYPVILSTTHSLKSCLKEDYLYDYVIIDESSQVDIVTGALAFSCAKNIVVVGDLKQLTIVATEDKKEIANKIYYKFNLNVAYKYSENSILSSVLNLFKDVPKTLLKEHYRCHPLIIGFCNKKFYNNELIILSENTEIKDVLKVYKTPEGNHARGNLNQRQIDIIVNEILRDKENFTTEDNIGIASPYCDQIDEVKKAIDNENIEAKTVHKFQGRERDVIILSTVSNQINDFIDNPNLINVAVSRAIKKLILVVSGNDEKNKNTNIGDLIKYIEYNNFTPVESKIYSVFDLLYTSYSNKLVEFYKKAKKVSKYDSENLINFLIEEILSKSELNNLGKIMHQPLKKLIKDISKLDSEEYKFAMNILTHTDFLIFNEITKEPVLVVEVDGYAYHNKKREQLRRDHMKDEILNKYDIPILRLKTNESGEKEKLYNKLIEILNKK